ncbi:MAG: CBS domain-containing protein [Candidatus Altiarchaeales archaeon]|nr:CBS domain-containing protein [Candidatus Altiarchaeales archaeon]
MYIDEVMTRGIITICREESTAKAMKMMTDRRVTSLIVEKVEGGDYGIITRKDLINKVIAVDKDPTKVMIGEVMSSPLLVISPKMTLENVARLMAKTDIRRFPVVEGDEIIGLLSNSDILRAVTLERLS